MTEREQKAIKWIKNVRDNAVVILDHIAKNELNVSPMLYTGRKEKAEIILNAFDKLEQYRALGKVEELSTSAKEEDILKFYYCESRDDYYIGKRIDTMYYAKYSKTGFTWFMSRYLPWGKHVADPNTLWKEHTYPSEPKEIPFFEWLQGFLKKYCGGTVEELQETMEKQRAKKPRSYDDDYSYFVCDKCGEGIFCSDDFASHKYCLNCGQAIDWSEKE